MVAIDLGSLRVANSSESRSPQHTRRVDRASGWHRLITLPVFAVDDFQGNSIAPVGAVRPSSEWQLPAERAHVVEVCVDVRAQLGSGEAAFLAAELGDEHRENEGSVVRPGGSAKTSSRIVRSRSTARARAAYGNQPP